VVFSCSCDFRSCFIEHQNKKDAKSISMEDLSPLYDFVSVPVARRLDDDEVKLVSLLLFGETRRCLR
jgi:hypothetical protein